MAWPRAWVVLLGLAVLLAGPAIATEKMAPHGAAARSHATAQAVKRHHGPADAAAQAEELNDKAAPLYQSGRYAEAIVLAEKALALREQALGPEHPDTAAILNNLAELYLQMGAYATAEPLYQRALAISEKALGPEHPDTARCCRACETS